MILPIAVLDACVLIPVLDDASSIIIQGAKQNLYKFYTSDKILEETERNLGKILQKKQKTWEISEYSAQEIALQRIKTLEKDFPQSLVKVSEELIITLKNNPKDRHVLAAAIEARKIQSELEINQTIWVVTYNLKDFPHRILEQYNTKAIHPDNFLLQLVEIHGLPVFLSLLKAEAEKRNYNFTKLIEVLKKNKLTKFTKLISKNY